MSRPERTVVRTLLAIAVALGCAVAGTACGGGDEPPSKDAYESKLRGVMQDMNTKYGATLAKQDATPEDLDDVRAGLLDTADALDAITPAQGLEDEHADLVGGVRGLGEATADLAKARRLVDSDPAQARVLTKRFAEDPSLARIAAAAAALKKSGVDAGL